MTTIRWAISGDELEAYILSLAIECAKKSAWEEVNAINEGRYD